MTRRLPVKCGYCGYRGASWLLLAGHVRREHEDVRLPSAEQLDAEREANSVKPVVHVRAFSPWNRGGFSEWGNPV